MPSVTQRIRNIRQPRGGYVNPKHFEAFPLDDEHTLNSKENIHPSLIGLTVDYLSRWQSGSSLEQAFRISLEGAEKLDRFSHPGSYEEVQKANTLLNNIKGLDDDSIFFACKLAGYDSAFRAGIKAHAPVETINADKETVDNIRVMVKRCLVFFKEYGPIEKMGFNFNGGYTDLIKSGDGDYLTSTTLWELKVSKYPPSKDHTLQLLTYYLMGLRSTDNTEFQQLENIGIFNPRLNVVYIHHIFDIPYTVVREVSRDIIGYY